VSQKKKKLTTSSGGMQKDVPQRTVYSLENPTSAVGTGGENDEASIEHNTVAMAYCGHRNYGGYARCWWLMLVILAI
jgi:hypothetical protein